MALLLVILPLLGCPPVRENIADADGGGSYVDAFFSYRHLAGYQVYASYLIIPREEEEGTFDCDDGTNYGWYDDDADYFDIDFLKGEDVDWTGEYPSFYDPECDSYSSYDYAIAHCRTTHNGVDPEGMYVDDQSLEFSISSFDESRVDGQMQYRDGLSERFRAINCGELPSYYYYDGRSSDEAEAEPADDGQERPQGGWQLRIK
jgi:hypothetical protein